jgi:hypothetical protein
MARADLRALIGNLGAPDPPATSIGTPPESSPAAVSTPVAQPVPSRSAPTQPTAQQQSGGRPGVIYSDFERKETRLRPDQQNALTEHARRLNRAKRAGGQRITDNTLIRVAIDLLLSKTDKLAGDDEPALRRSVGLRADES